MRRFLFCFLLLLLPAAVDGAGDGALDRATLRGLKAISVVVDRFDPALAKEGFSEGSFQSRIEERLQNAGLPVGNNSTEFLGLRLLQVRDGRGPYAVCLSLGLYQGVALNRDPNLKTATQTWEVQTILMAAPRIVYRASLESADELADRFISAWRSVNQR